MYRFITGCFLAVLICAVMFINAWIFSARALQNEVSKLVADGTAVSLSQVLGDAERLMTEQQKLATEEQAMSPQLAASTVAEQQWKADQAKLDQVVDAAAKRLNAAAQAVGVPPPSAGQGSVVIDAERLRVELSRIASASANVNPGLARSIAEVQSTLDGVRPLEAAAASAREKAEQAKAITAQMRSSIQTRRDDLLKRSKVYGTVAGQVQSMSDAHLGFGLWLAKVPPVFLTTTLVLAMGALGAVLYLLPMYIHENGRVTFALIIFRMLFGMTTALAFYIIANTSIAAFGASGGTVDSMASLNPFTVSALGIIAGVMSEEIAKWITQRGGYLLSGAAGRVTSEDERGAAARRSRSASDLGVETMDAPSASAPTTAPPPGRAVPRRFDDGDGDIEGDGDAEG
jgi:hypothetical protein